MKTILRRRLEFFNRTGITETFWHWKEANAPQSLVITPRGKVQHFDDVVRFAEWMAAGASGVHKGDWEGFVLNPFTNIPAALVTKRNALKFTLRYYPDLGVWFSPVLRNVTESRNFVEAVAKFMALLNPANEFNLTLGAQFEEEMLTQTYKPQL